MDKLLTLPSKKEFIYQIMRKLLALSMALFIGMATHAQINKNDMENQTKTIRLVYPQWQGGNIASWITEVKDPEQASRGYYRSASVVPFTYLSERYKGDVAMVWIDAHPDITLPGDVYPAYHAMAVTACMGLGDKQIVSELPAKIDPSKILFVGLRDWERDEIKERQKRYGLKHLTPEDVRNNSSAILEWLKSCGASKVVIHFDMDVLDPAEIIAAVGVVPNGMKIAEVVRVINDIAQEKKIVGLTVAEPMPRTAIRIKEMLNQLPLLK